MAVNHPWAWGTSLWQQLGLQFLQILFSRRKKKQNGTWATVWPCFSLFVIFFCGRGAFKFAKHCGFPPCGCKFDKLVPLLRSAVCGKSGSLMWNSACALLRTEALVQRGQTLGAVPHWGNMNQVMSKCCLASTNGSKADTCEWIAPFNFFYASLGLSEIIKYY